MQFVLKYMLIARYGWRWAIVRVSDREVIRHRKHYYSGVSDLREMETEPMQYVYEGRRKPKLSVLSAIRQIEGTSIPLPAPGSVRQSLYPKEIQ